MCHMSHVTCNMSHVTCDMSQLFLFNIFLTKWFSYRWRVCYQPGLPRLVLLEVLKTCLSQSEGEKTWLKQTEKGQTYLIHCKGEITRVFQSEWDITSVFQSEWKITHVFQSKGKITCLFQSSVAEIHLQQQQLFQQFSLLHRNIAQVLIQLYLSDTNA